MRQSTISVALVVTVIAALALAAAAVAGQPDPRKCSYSTSPAQCGKRSAINALKRKQSLLFDHANSGWDADITCTGAGPNYLLWTCTWTSYPTDTPGRATVKFWATSSGWHTLVTIIAQAIKH